MCTLYSNILNQYEISLPRLSSNRANLDLNSAAPSHCCWAAFQASWDTTRLFVLSQGICSTWWMHRNGSRAYCRTPWLKEQHETQASATKSIAFIFIFFILLSRKLWKPLKWKLLCNLLGVFFSLQQNCTWKNYELSRSSDKCCSSEAFYHFAHTGNKPPKQHTLKNIFWKESSDAIVKHKERGLITSVISVKLWVWKKSAWYVSYKWSFKSP